MGLFRHGVALAAVAAFSVFLIIALPPYGGNMFNITNVLINIGRLSVVNIIRLYGVQKSNVINNFYFKSRRKQLVFHGQKTFCSFN
jgi:hypothetical protein